MDYKKLGFMAGIEAHQQLEGKKLFCDCPALVNDTNPITIKFSRKLRTTNSEMGTVDKAAKFEMEKQLTYNYEATKTSSCLVEFDEEPPHNLNQEHLKTALQVAILMHAKPFDEIQFMRKVVIDGSNTTGFQRTALIADNGYINTSKGKVRIEGIFLEEEASKKISETETSKTYRLDRQGVALLEIATAPDIKDPEHTKEVASLIGMIIRSTGKAKRGIGSIRQDINVNIKGHPRVEIKGFQELKAIEKTIKNEIQRQIKILKEKKYAEEHVRKGEPDFTTKYLRPMPGTARMYPETDIEKIMITKQLLNQIEIPELITERTVNLEKKYKIKQESARQIIKQNIPFEYYTENFKIKPEIIEKILIEYPKEIKKRFNIKIKATKTQLELLFSNLEKQELSKEAIHDILIQFTENKTPNFNKYKVNTKDLEKEIKEIIENNKNSSFNAIMGELMKHFKGKVDGKTAAKLLKKYL